MASSNTVQSLAVYVTFTFGHVAMAYLAGRDLARPQAMTMSGLYVCTALSALQNFTNDLDSHGAAVTHAPDVTPEGAISDEGFREICMSIPVLLGIAATPVSHVEHAARRRFVIPAPADPVGWEAVSGQQRSRPCVGRNCTA